MRGRPSFSGLAQLQDKIIRRRDERCVAARSTYREDTMKRILMLAVAFACAAGLAPPAPAQDLASQIVGVWKSTGWVRKEVATGKVDKLYGDQPVGHWVFTKGGRTLVLTVAQDRKKPAAPVITDPERVELQKSMFAYSGSYKVEGTKLMVRVEASWNQSWTGTEQVRQIEIAGNKLTIITLPFKSMIDGVEQVVTTTYERVE